MITDGDEKLRVFVSVGTDHHTFDRLVAWMDDWFARQSGDAIECVIQHGSSRAPYAATGIGFLDHADLQVEFARATAVVCHGGPATIMEARRAGHVPIVVPRDPARREHVDDHQMRFARYAEVEGLIRTATSIDALETDLARTLSDPEGVIADTAAGQATTVAHVGMLIDEVLRTPRTWRISKRSLLSRNWDLPNS